MRQVCRNRGCKSYGTSHPNCRCMGRMAEGGKVRAFCDSDNEHEKTCGYYKGGEVQDIDHSKFDLSKFKKADSNDTHTMFQHPDGHVIYVAHKAMTEEQTKDAKALPFTKLNKGGYVPLPQQGPKLNKEKTAAFTQGLKSAFGIKKMSDGGKLSEEDVVDVMQAAEANQGLRQAPEMITPQVTMTQRDMPGYKPVALDVPARPDSINTPPVYPTPDGQPIPAPVAPSPLDQQVQAIQKAADVESALARDQARLAREQEKALISVQERFAKQIESLEKERVELTEAVANNKIDPGSYMENQSTPAKVATVIGIILGGFGSKPGGENQAVKHLNDQIDRDIKAQQLNMDKQNNMLKFNMQRTADLNDAMKLTRAQLQEIYATKLEQAAAKSKDPMAQARAMQAIGQIRTTQAAEMAPVIARMALSKRPMSIEEAQAAIETPMVPKERRAEAAKELEFIAGLNTAIKDSRAAYDTVRNLGVSGAGSAAVGKLVPGGTESSRLLQQANATIEGLVRANRPPGSGPMSDADAAAMIDPYKLTIGDLTNPDAIAAKERGLITKLQAGYSKAGTLNSLGIKVAPPQDIPKTLPPDTATMASKAAEELARRKASKK